MPLDQTPSFSKGRRWIFSLNVAITVGALLAIVLMINYLASRHFLRLPVSNKAEKELSPLTRKVLNSITNDINVIIYFIRPADGTEALYDSVWALLKEYKFANSKISVKSVDPERDHALAEIVKAKYKVSDRNVIIFDNHGAYKVVPESALSDFDYNDLIAGKSKEVKRKHFKGELEFTSAILNITTPQKLKAYFLRGHREHSPTDEDKLMGYSKFADVLRENGIGFDTVDIVGTADIPADCHLLIIPGPKDPFLQDELDKIDKYLQQGGRLFVLFNYTPLPRETGLEKLLANWGVLVGANVVQDKENAVRVNDMVVSQFKAHPLMKPLFNSGGLYMILPRSVKGQSSAATADAPQAESLAFTGSKGRVITDIRPGLTMYESPNDYIGPVPILAAVEKGKISGVRDRGSTRIVVVGESIFLANETLDKLGNHEFATHSLNWLMARDEFLVNLPPRAIKEYKLQMTESQSVVIMWVLLVGMPGSMLLLGSLVWFRRRN